MPTGDAQRVWFPEMIDEVKAQWRHDMSWEKMIQLCWSMEEKRKEIRKERSIRSVKIQRKNCQYPR